jgi:hypothetical protein
MKKRRDPAPKYRIKIETEKGGIGKNTQPIDKIDSSNISKLKRRDSCAHFFLLRYSHIEKSYALNC